MSTEVFAFTDIEGSTRRWASEAAEMRQALALHDHLVISALTAGGGEIVKHTGDGLLARFTSAPAAVAAAVEAQLALHGADWGSCRPLPVRVALHAGEAERQGEDWFGPALNRCARLLALAHGGQVLASSAVRALCTDALPPGVRLHDLGEHRLRDLSTLEHVWQVEAKGLRLSFPPLRSLPHTSGNLPVPLTRFVGREAELAALVPAVLADRVTTLVGAGGMGKTRLALQVAAVAAEQFEHGAWLVELAPLQSSDGVDHAVAAALQVDPVPGVSPRELVIAELADRRLLLVLDNCEHVRRPAANLVRDLTTRCPRVSILATSREPLHVAGEQVWMLTPLPPDGAGAELFIERAGAARRGGGLCEDDRGLIVEVCRRLDGMPLAIELAASRIRSMTVAELNARLDRPFRLLSAARGDGADPRHRTLQAVVQWSYDLLEPVEQRLLCRLSVFAGSFDLDAAHAVCVAAADDDEDLVGWDDLDTLAVLDALVDRSLLVADDVDGRTRYRLLETIRQWAATELGDDAGWCAEAHRRYYTELLRRFRLADGGLVELETDNLRLAVHQGISTGDTAGALALIRRLWRHVTVSVVLLEAEDWARTALALPGADDEPDGVWAHLLLAGVGNIAADPDRMVCEARTAIAQEQRLGLEPEAVARWWLCVGEVWRGNYEAATVAAYSALDVLRPGQRAMRLEIVFQLVCLAVYAGSVPDEQLTEQWRQTTAEVVSPLEQFIVEYGDGVLASPTDPLIAAAHFRRAWELSEQSALNHVVAGSARAYAGLLAAGGDCRQALTELAAALAVYRTKRVAFGLRRLVRDFLPAFEALGDHDAVAILDGAAAVPAMRAKQVDATLSRAQATLGVRYRQTRARGAAMSDAELERFVLDRLSVLVPAGDASGPHRRSTARRLGLDASP